MKIYESIITLLLRNKNYSIYHVYPFRNENYSFVQFSHHKAGSNYYKLPQISIQAAEEHALVEAAAAAMVARCTPGRRSVPAVGVGTRCTPRLAAGRGAQQCSSAGRRCAAPRGTGAARRRRSCTSR